MNQENDLLASWKYIYTSHHNCALILKIYLNFEKKSGYHLINRIILDAGFELLFKRLCNIIMIKAVKKCARSRSDSSLMTSPVNQDTPSPAQAVSHAPQDAKKRDSSQEKGDCFIIIRHVI